jgi:hypothetical protein
MISKKEFTEKVEKLIAGDKCDVISAVLKVCEESNIEPEGAKRLLSTPLKDKLEAEATGLNLVNRGKKSKGNLTSFYQST